MTINSNSQTQQQNLRSALGCFTTGITIVCAEHNKDLRGFTANSFSSVSLSPPLVSVCLDTQAQCMDVFRECERFCISVLAKNQEDIAHHFAYFHGDRFANMNFHKTKLGSPIIENSLAWFDCICQNRFILGDHLMLIGRVEDFYCRDEDISPLIFFRGNYTLGDNR